jgi:RNA polymerase sigma factor (sigma-70 family)
MSADPFLDCLQAARSGDRRAIDALIQQFYSRVQTIVHRSLAADLFAKRPWLASMFSTGDVVQEVFVGVLRDLEAFEGLTESSFASYLATAVKNRLIDAIRFHEAIRRDRRRTQDADHIDDLASVAPEPASAAIRAEELELFCRVIAALPPRERLLLRERIDRAETFRCLAEQLGYPSEDAARKAFYTAQSRLVLRLRAAGLALDRTSLDVPTAATPPPA